LVVPQPQIRCIRNLLPRLNAICEQLAGSQIGEPNRALTTVSQAQDWADTALGYDEAYRSAQVFVVPAGTTPKPMEWCTRLNENGTRETAQQTCVLLQKARAKMSRVLKDPLLRQTVVEALTPVDMIVRYATNSGVGWVRVEITNNCDLDASGAVKVNVPKGWAAKARKPTFVGLKSGAVWTQSFKLTPASKGQTAPNQLSVAATVKVADKAGYAKLQFVRYAELQSN